jgi:hypothetical protein
LAVFETSEEPEQLAETLSEVIDGDPSCWYTDFTCDNEKFVIFPKRVLRYRVGDTEGRREAPEYAISIGVPAAQADRNE